MFFGHNFGHKTYFWVVFFFVYFQPETDFWCQIFGLPNQTMLKNGYRFYCEKLWDGQGRLIWTPKFCMEDYFWHMQPWSFVPAWPRKFYFGGAQTNWANWQCEPIRSRSHPPQALSRVWLRICDTVFFCVDALQYFFVSRPKPIKSWGLFQLLS